MKIVIIGCGALGSAIKNLFDVNNHKFQDEIAVVAWDKFHPQLELEVKQQELKDALLNVDYVFFCVGASQLNGAFSDVLSVSVGTFVSVIFSKGLDSETGLNVADLISTNYPQNKYYLLSGPMLSTELSSGLAGYATLVSNEPYGQAELSGIFSNIGIYNEVVNADPSAYAYLGVLKNIYAVFLGAIDCLFDEMGIENRNNFKGYLFLEIYKEMSVIIESLGYDSSILKSLAGLADLISTGIGPTSINYQSGSSLIQTGTNENKGEGLSSLENMLAKISLDEREIPIITLLGDCNDCPSDARNMLLKYLQKPK